MGQQNVGLLTWKSCVCFKFPMPSQHGFLSIMIIPKPQPCGYYSIYENEKTLMLTKLWFKQKPRCSSSLNKVFLLCTFYNQVVLMPKHNQTLIIVLSDHKTDLEDTGKQSHPVDRASNRKTLTCEGGDFVVQSQRLGWLTPISSPSGSTY